ncbi:MAG: SH3 domain-containing protein [Clostridia bacterium]|nr:SH3 domain-containing protein [Clostridia bacterium]
MRRPIMLLAVILGIAVLSGGLSAYADTGALPFVTDDMCQPAWWAEKTAEPGALLADTETIEAMNAAFVAEPDCRMTDMTAFIPAYDGDVFQRERVKDAMSALSEYMGDGFFLADGAPVRYADVADILASIDDARAESNCRVRYGICVRLADIRAVPADLLITDDAADIDYDVLQNSSVRVNEPVIVRAQTADGSWYYCDSACVSGWIAAEHIAICKNRREWLSAWQIPEEERLVVTQGKLYLDEANVNREASERMLTMGTTLRKVREVDFDPKITNRAVFHNHAVWLPVRDGEGRYGTTIALIPEHASVSEGTLSLTAENILNVAFSMLGDAYGWGGMLGVPDCSQYVRNVYKCFGFELPRNTTWQSAMPAMKINLTDMSAEEKAEALDALPVGTILFFKGHEMLYLGAHDGRHYVLSSVGSIMNPNGEGVLRIRSVVINTLEDTVRGNGNTWLKDLNQATVPWLPEEATEEAADRAA